MIRAKNHSLGFKSHISNSLEILLARLRAITPRRAASAPIAGITSCRCGEGVTTTAISLAITGAAMIADRSKSVLLVDANTVVPSLHVRLHLNQGFGFSDVLAGNCTLEAAAQPSGVPGLRVLPCGRFDELISADSADSHVEQFFQQACKEYRLVVLDLPPVERPNELMRFARQVDQLLLVIESGRVSAETLLQSIRFLNDAHVGEPWTVLNKWRDPMPQWLARRLG